MYHDLAVSSILAGHCEQYFVYFIISVVDRWARITCWLINFTSMGKETAPSVTLFIATQCLLCRHIFIFHTFIQIERTGLEMYGTAEFNEDSTRQAIYTYTRTQQSGAFAKPSLQCKSNKYYIIWVCVCSLRYPACNAHAPYCYLWPVRSYNIFSHYLINTTILEIGHNMCFDFLDKFFWNIIWCDIFVNCNWVVTRWQ